ncbi:MAG: hypothetical protein WC994_00250 [Brumimicrobium sp.]
MDEQKKSKKGKTKRLINFLVLILVFAVLILFTVYGNKVYQDQTKAEIITKQAPYSLDVINTLEEIDKEKQINISDFNFNESDFDSKNIVKVINDTITVYKVVKENPSKNSGGVLFHFADEVYLNKIKIVDYKTYRDQMINTESLVNQSIYNESESTYYDLIESATFSFLSRKYKEALQKYMVILSNYPNDVNANFYTGICFFNLGEFEQAVGYFDKSYSIGYGNFREEAMWFTALANYEIDNLIGSRHFLKRIIKEEGYYLEPAKDLLTEIE